MKPAARIDSVDHAENACDHVMSDPGFGSLSDLPSAPSIPYLSGSASAEWEDNRRHQHRERVINYPSQSNSMIHRKPANSSDPYAYQHPRPMVGAYRTSSDTINSMLYTETSRPRPTTIFAPVLWFPQDSRDLDRTRTNHNHRVEHNPIHSPVKDAPSSSALASHLSVDPVASDPPAPEQRSMADFSLPPLSSIVSPLGYIPPLVETRPQDSTSQLRQIRSEQSHHRAQDSWVTFSQASEDRAYQGNHRGAEDIRSGNQIPWSTTNSNFMLPFVPTMQYTEQVPGRSLARDASTQTLAGMSLPQADLTDSLGGTSLLPLDRRTLHDRPRAVPVSRKKKVKAVMKLKCTACLDDFLPKDTTTLPCACQYCFPCLNALFRAGCSSIVDFPPKCHGRALRLNIYGTGLEQHVVERYKAVEAEFGSRKPLYCARSTCSTFITPDMIINDGQHGFCVICNQCTCVKCKMLSSMHKSGICPEQPNDVVALLDLGEEQAWKQCPSCESMVEKLEGCNHIECQCGIEFCYRCGSLFDENDDCKCARDDDSDEEGVDDDDIWPDHRRIVDPLGRPRCLHPATDIIDGEVCHGCLKPPMDGLIHSCIDCNVEICQECMAQLRAKDEQSRTHSDSTE